MAIDAPPMAHRVHVHTKVLSDIIQGLTSQVPFYHFYSLGMSRLSSLHGLSSFHRSMEEA